MGFMWEGSTGSRALAILKGLPQGTALTTADLAARLGVKPRALHQLLAHALQLRLIAKVRRRGVVSVSWRIGPGNVSATVERRRAPEGKPRRRRPRGEAPPPVVQPEGRRFQLDPPWPPGFVSPPWTPTPGDEMRRLHVQHQRGEL
ncbi:MAG: hypothetical protein ACTHL8_18920 [Burkholderiaceae bacterium]